MKSLWKSSAAAAAIILTSFATAQAQTQWVHTSGSNFWSVNTNWNPVSIPDAPGAAVQFNPTTALNIVYLDDDYTVGSMLFDFSGSVSNNDHHLDPDELFPGVLRMDNNGNGATITTQATVGPATTPNTDIAVDMVLDDDLTLAVNQTNTTSSAGSLSIAGEMSGSGGVTKTGAGTLTYISGAKTYTGPTEFMNGKIRIRGTDGVPTMTSSFRLHSGAWIEPGLDGTVAFGTGNMYLNGSGDSAFPGVIRPDRTGNATTGSGRIFTITNPIVLESDSTLHSQTQNNTALGSITFSNVVSGPGALLLTATGHNEQIGSYILQSANTYEGGTELRAGTLRVGAAATLGSGDVWIMDGRFLADGVTVVNGAAVSQLVLEGTGLSNAIANDAKLTLGTAAHLPTIPSLNISTDETVGQLFLGSTPLPNGVYTAATHPSYITGSGSVTVIGAAVEDADFDGDGDVDGADFLTWQRNVEVNSGGTNAQGDADGNGDVNGADLAIWKSDFGNVATAAAGAVPEPSAALLSLLAAPLALLGRRKR